MTKIKALYIVIFLLTILNIVTIGKLFFSKDERPNRKMPREIIVEKLKFDTKQANQYFELIKEHRAKIDSLDNQIKNSKKVLYSYLTQPENQKAKDSIIASIASSQTVIEKTHFNHFLDIKKLCKPNQLKDFENLAKDLTSIFAKPKKRHEK